MAFRGTESPMDFEWQGYGPMDVNSPFHKLAMDKHKKRTHADFDSPVKTSVPALREPNSQPWFFSNPPAAPSPGQYRAPSFTTPHKPADFDFSSGPESSPAGQADDEDTPNSKPLPPLPVEFTDGKLSTKRNSLFGLYGRFAPSPGRGEIKKPASDVMAKKILKRRRKAQNFEKQIALRRQSIDDTSDDDARPSSSESRSDPNYKPKAHEVGWMTGLFTFIHTYPDAPSIIAKYLQVFFNAAILGGCLYMFWCFYATIRADLDHAAQEAASRVLAESALCLKEYIENKCAPDTRLPALETTCNNWELCMNRDVNAVKKASLSARTFAEIFNSFVEPISWKTMQVDTSRDVQRFAICIKSSCDAVQILIFTTTFVFLGLFVNNATFTLYRRSQEQQHANHDYRYPSGSMQPGGTIGGYHPAGLNYTPRHQVGWQEDSPSFADQRYGKKRLDYQRSPSKEYGRSRSRSPEKKRIMLE